MREIVLDTETTGIDPAQGHRIIEIGALENHVDSAMTKPNAGWPVGTYQVQISVDGTLKQTVDFSVKK